MIGAVTTHGRRGAIPRDTCGNTLFELLVCVAVFVIVVNVIMSIFDSGTRLSSLAIERFDRMDGALALQNGFVKAMREAVRVADGIGSHHTSPETLVLRLPDADSGARYAVLGRLSQGECLCRMDVTDQGGTMEATSFVRYPLPLASFHFGFDTEDADVARLVSLEYEIKRAPDEHGKPLRHRLASAIHSFSQEVTHGSR